MCLEFPISLAKLTVSQQFPVPQRQISFLLHLILIFDIYCHYP